MPRQKSALEKSVPRRPRLEPTPDSCPPLPYDLHLEPGRNVILRAKHLAVFYQALKSQVPGVRWVPRVSPSSQSFRSFIRAAQYLVDWEKSNCRRVSDVDYVLAHLWYWGKACFTTRLSSSSSMALYDAFMRLQTASRVEDDPDLDAQYETDLLNYLSRLRGESVSLLRESLKESGLLLP